MTRFKNLVLIVLFLLVFSSFALANDILLRDDWFVIEQNGVPSGMGNDQFFKTDDGYLYRAFFQMNMEVLGTPFSYMEHIESWVDEEFRLTQVLQVTDFDGAQTRRETNISYGDDLTELSSVIIDQTGKSSKSYWNWEGVYPLYDSSALIDKVIVDDGFIVGAVHTFNTWHLGDVTKATLQIEEETTIIYAEEEIPIFIARLEIGELVTKAYLDHEGTSYLIETEGAGQRIIKVEENSIPELRTIAADVLMVPANLIIEHPYRSTFSLITVDWLDVPMEDFVWEDNRQQIAQVFGESSLQLEIKRDFRDFTGLVTLPVQKLEFAPYLADTDYIHPSSPVVQSLVQEILDGETDAWIATELLLDWVFNNMTAKMVARTLTTDEILETRTGKCAEYATLFAALARAAGLPTKISLGERYQGNIWVGHLWNEVWLGEWISVDPSHNQINPDATLIKFIDSDTIMGTQGVRVDLVNKLNITIDEIEIEELVMDGYLETGLVGREYSNWTYSCAITMPEGWEGIETEDQGFPVLVMYNPEFPDFTALLVMMSVPPGNKAEQLMASRLLIFPSILPGFELLEQTTGIISGETANIASWSFNEEPVLIQENRIIVKEDLAYLFVFTGPQDTWPNQQEFIEEIVTSFITYR